MGDQTGPNRQVGGVVQTAIPNGSEAHSQEASLVDHGVDAKKGVSVLFVWKACGCLMRSDVSSCFGPASNADPMQNRRTTGDAPAGQVAGFTTDIT